MTIPHAMNSSHRIERATCEWCKREYDRGEGLACFRDTAPVCGVVCKRARERWQHANRYGFERFLWRMYEREVGR